jgi:hypothetical protein
VHHRDEKERDNGRRHMEERARDAAGGKEQEEEGSESVLTNPTDAQAGGGDSDLRHRQILAHAVDDKNRVLGCLHALTD